MEEYVHKVRVYGILHDDLIYNCTGKKHDIDQRELIQTMHDQYNCQHIAL